MMAGAPVWLKGTFMKHSLLMMMLQAHFPSAHDG